MAIMRRSAKTVLIVFMLAVLAGCAPVITKKTLDTVDRTIKFSDIVKNPDSYKDRSVVLGGVIINVENLENRTVIEVLHEELNFQLKPVNPEGSQGRFLVEFDGFKDPAIYYKGRSITVAGAIKGSEKRKLGKTEYTYPVIAPKESYLWSTAYGESPVAIGVGLGFTHGF